MADVHSTEKVCFFLNAKMKSETKRIKQITDFQKFVFSLFLYLFGVQSTQILI